MARVARLVAVAAAVAAVLAVATAPVRVAGVDVVRKHPRAQHTALRLQAEEGEASYDASSSRSSRSREDEDEGDARFSAATVEADVEADVDADAGAGAEAYAEAYATVDAETYAAAVATSEAEAAALAEAGIEPVTMAFLGLKTLALVAQLTYTFMTARAATSIELAGKLVAEIGEELDRDLAGLQNLLDAATGDAQRRMGDAVMEIADAVVGVAAVKRPAELTAYAGKALATTFPTPDEAGRVLRLAMQEDYDNMMGLGFVEPGSSPNAVKAKRRVLKGVAPTLSALQDVMAPVSKDALDSSMEVAGRKSAARSKGTGPNVAGGVFDKARKGAADVHAVLKSQLRAQPAGAVTRGGMSAAAADEEASAALAAAVDGLAEIMAGAEDDMPEFEEVVGASKTEALATVFKMDAEFLEEVGGGVDLAMAAVSTISSVKSVVDAYKLLRAKEFESWRRAGVARESSGDTRVEAEYNVCRLLLILYEQLKALALVDNTAAVTNQPWEKLVDGGLLAGLKLHDDPKLLGQLRVAVHAKLCSVFYPLRRRLGALFRNGGRCASLNAFGPAAKSGVMRFVSNIDTAETAASILTCHADDIYDVRLTTLNNVEMAKKQGWEVVASDEWQTGELNAELSVGSIRSFFGSGKEGQAKKPEYSRVLMVRRCKSIIDMSTRKRKFNIKENPELVQPITDIKVVIRTDEAVKAGEVSKTEANLLEAGYTLVKFEAALGGSARLRTESANAVAPSNLHKFLASVRNKFTWWDAAEYGHKYIHSEPEDLNFMRSEDKPPLFAYARRGVAPTPLRQLILLPFLANGAAKASDIPKVSFMVEVKRPSFTAGFNAANSLPAPAKGAPSMEVGAFYTFDMPDMVVPSSSRCKAVGRRQLRDLVTDGVGGLKNRLLRFVVHRQWSSSVTVEKVDLGFNTTCEEVGTNMRWYRVPVSPYEGSAGDSVTRMLYLWQQKAYAPVAIPDTTLPESPCPDMCAMSDNTFVNANRAQTTTKVGGLDKATPVGGSVDAEGAVSLSSSKGKKKYL